MSLENVRVEATCRVSRYGQTKGVLTKSKWDCKHVVQPTRCVEIVDGGEGLKDHYRLKGQTYLGKGELVDLKLKMSRCDGYGYRVIDWKYV